jgi:HAD superfamily hydrolase (TIGR01509 family)
MGRLGAQARSRSGDTSVRTDARRTSERPGSPRRERRLSAIDAVTLDAYGTLLGLVDPLPKLGLLLPEHAPGAIERAFRAEAAYYAAHSAEARDGRSLARLHADCTAVFNQALGSTLTPDQYVGALEFEVLEGVTETLRWLQAHGFALAVVANWDFSLHEHLRRHALDHFFATIVVAGEIGAPKPDPRPFLVALERLGVPPERAVHVGDHANDEDGAAAAGMHFAPAPLPAALEEWA